MNPTRPTSPLACGALLLALLASACNRNAAPISLRSLEASGRVSFLCLGAEGAPRSLDDCPDTYLAEVDGEDRHLVSMLTQTLRGEVAVVDLTGGAVLDQEPTIPGYNFLPVGASPVSIVSTPGSVATFVAVAEVGKEGIFGLPTSCVVPRAADEPLRDLASWPACRLPSAPGDMAILVDPLVDDDGDPSTPEVMRASCAAGSPRVPVEDLRPVAATREFCPADLTAEAASPGRRKLLVALPEQGTVAVIDAQGVLDREPGSYEPCAIEQYVPLRSTRPTGTVEQTLPPDLATGCRPSPLVPRPDEGPFAARPAGFAQVDDPLTGEHRVFVADLDAPLVHVLDTRDACAVVEEAPLLPASFLDPGRIVTTRKVAASPLTSAHQRFLYAIDDLGGGSVMIFDVSEGATDRTPLVRRRSTELPYEAPDRIAFDAPAREVAFALHDSVKPDPDTGNQSVGVLCDPLPSHGDEPGAQYRPVADLSSGARPSTLRGVFGFVALSSGQIAAIDVEDFDQPCRRPIQANPGTTEDFRGCAGDPDIGYFTTDPRDETSTPTVTGEVSCHVVEPHRVRSAYVARADSGGAGVRAPAIRAMPRLVTDTGRALVTDRSPDGLANPRMLAVNFGPDSPAELYVGATLRRAKAGKQGEKVLEVSPATADELSVLLSFSEPRAHAPREDFSARYEGVVVDERPTARLTRKSTGSGSVLTLVDGGIVFCDRGIEDEAVTRARAPALGVAEASFTRFGEAHADYVRVRSELPPETDAYWSGAGATCGGALASEPGGGYLQCSAIFGTRDTPTVWRELRVVEATRDTLTVVPRHARNASQREYVSSALTCCFPELVSYEVRASAEWIVRGSQSGFRHDVTTDGSTGRCIVDCSPFRSRLRSRAFEVSCAGEGCALDADGEETIGPPGAGEVACVLSPGDPLPTTIGAAGEGCIYRGLATSFTIYKGREPSRRDTEFVWSVTGGFSPFIAANLATSSDPNVSPSSLVYSPQQGALLLADGSSKGLVEVDLATFAVRVHN